MPTTDGSTYPPSAGAPSTDGSTDPPRSRHAFALYNLARLGMLAVAFGVFYLVGLRGLGLVVAAFLVSGAVSYLVLYRVRVAASMNIGSSFRRLSDRIDKGSRAEDD